MNMKKAVALLLALLLVVMCCACGGYANSYVKVTTSDGQTYRFDTVSEDRDSAFSAGPETVEITAADCTATIDFHCGSCGKSSITHVPKTFAGLVWCLTCKDGYFYIVVDVAIG